MSGNPTAGQEGQAGQEGTEPRAKRMVTLSRVDLDVFHDELERFMRRFEGVLATFPENIETVTLRAGNLALVALRRATQDMGLELRQLKQRLTP